MLQIGRYKIKNKKFNMLSDKRNLITAKATGLILSLFDVASSLDVPSFANYKLSRDQAYHLV